MVAICNHSLSGFSFLSNNFFLISVLLSMIWRILVCPLTLWLKCLCLTSSLCNFTRACLCCLASVMASRWPWQRAAPAVLAVCLVLWFIPTPSTSWACCVSSPLVDPHSSSSCACCVSSLVLYPHKSVFAAREPR